MNEEWVRGLDERVAVFRSRPLAKLARMPVRLLGSKLLEAAALATRRSWPWTARTFWGDPIGVVVPEPVSLSILRYGFFEEGLSRIMLEYVKPGQVVFDVGAHFGYFTLLASSLVGPTGAVHSFEPTPRTFERLQSNARRRSNVVVRQCAVWSERTTCRLRDFGVLLSGYNTLLAARMPRELESRADPFTFEVQAVSLDEYVAENCVVPSFVKIDAESAEYPILLGMERTLREHRPMVSVEVGDLAGEGERAGASRRLVDHLLERGYDVIEYAEGAIRRHEPQDHYLYGNLAFVPS